MHAVIREVLPQGLHMRSIGTVDGSEIRLTSRYEENPIFHRVSS